eukprot:CAMPEP_0179194322 /NCGR_PEP_ID=MMETSP0796-20121207/96579_1 /TAXON_ID=73915 /ORGANISM="Pyrodinium bahamense, Strain pbaha01" /LENGTH=550 /DNA_ID=CAMNT_0020898647 /DNA_START=36 /DNA_END=1688 /DNA_ORIENTATION=+
MTLSDEELRAQLDQSPLPDVVRGNPELLLRVRGIPELKEASSAVPIEVVLPPLADIPAAVKFPPRRPSGSDPSLAEPTAELPPAPAGFEKNADGSWGSAFAPLAELVEHVKEKLLVDIEQGSTESIALAESAASGLVAVGRLYKRIEPRYQLVRLTVPGHEKLVEFGLELLRAAARAKNGRLADAACKLLIGGSFDRLCGYKVTEDFDVPKCRGLEDGWKPAPEDADLYGIGWALLHNDGPGGVLSGLRVLNMLTSAEKWLVAQTALGLMGDAVAGAKNGSHTGPAGPSPLREGLAKCLTEAEVGELAGIYAAGAVIGFNQRSEHPGALMRAGLGSTLVKAWKDKSRPVTSALAAYALADLSQQVRQAHYDPWNRVDSEEEIASREVPSHVEDAEKWREQLRKNSAANRLLGEEYEAGQRLFTAELRAEGVALRPNRRKRAEADGAGGEAEEPEAGLEMPPSEEEAVEAAWEAVMPLLSAELKAKKPGPEALGPGAGLLPGLQLAPGFFAANGPDAVAWDSYCNLCDVLMEHYEEELEANEPGLYPDELP